MTSRLTLASRYYTDPGVFAREQERFFAEMWVAAARVEDLAAPGAFVLREIAGESVILIRDHDGTFRGFYNVCRHRGTRLCTEASGQLAGRIQCPYHAWTYDLGGRLIAAPHMEGTPGFCREEIALTPVAVDVWDGHVFACLHPSPPPLKAQVGALAGKFANWGMFELKRAYRVVYDVKANWKLIIQNYSECLHCPVIHPALQKLSHYMTGDNDPATPTWLGGRMELRPGIGTMTRDGQLRRAPLPRLDASEQRHVYYYALLPNLLLSLHPDYVLGPHRSLVRVALSPAGVPAPRLRSCRRHRFLGRHEPGRLAGIGAVAGGHRIARLSARLFLAAGRAALGLRPAGARTA